MALEEGSALASTLSTNSAAASVDRVARAPWGPVGTGETCPTRWFRARAPHLPSTSSSALSPRGGDRSLLGGSSYACRAQGGRCPRSAGWTCSCLRGAGQWGCTVSPCCRNKVPQMCSSAQQDFTASLRGGPELEAGDPGPRSRWRHWGGSLPASSGFGWLLAFCSLWLPGVSCLLCPRATCMPFL